MKKNFCPAFTSLSSPLPLKSGIIELSNRVSETTDSFHTPDSSSLKTRHSPTPPATNLQVIFDNYTIPTISW